MELKVVKFGGSSLADAEQFRKVANIIRSDDARRYVIPSAPGKRFDGDEKVTDFAKVYEKADFTGDFIIKKGKKVFHKVILK